MRLAVSALGAVAFAVGMLASHNGSAFEHQWHVGGGLGTASYAEGDSGISPAVGLHAAYGISDMFDLRLELLASRHGEDSGESLTIFSGAFGLAYKIDILEWIPYVGVLAGYYRFSGEPRPEFRNNAALSAILGLDYAWSRSFGTGAQLRYHGLLLEAPRSFQDAAYFTGTLRAEYRFGW